MVQAKRSQKQVSGDPNKLSMTDRPVHGWYRFVLSYPPHLVRDYLERFGLHRRHSVLDPFCGTGTTVVECKKIGIPSIGVEANPMAHFASSVKTDWSPDPDGLKKHATLVAKAASARLESEGHPDEETLPLFHGGSRNCGRAGASELLHLTDEQEKLLLRNSISPLPLHKTLVLVDCLKKQHDPRYVDHERLALAYALVRSISNLHFGPEVSVGRAKPDAAVVFPWLGAVEAIARDLREMKKWRDTPSWVYHADARQLADAI